MRVGATGLARVIALTTVIVSAFWVLLGGWLYNRHVRSHNRLVRQVEDVAPSPVALVPQPSPAVAPISRPTSASPVLNPMKLAIPVAGVRPAQLVDTFKDARENGARVHDAIDIMAPKGTPVLAAAPGTVEKLFLSKAGGNTIYVRSPDRRTIYYYAHLDRYAPGLAEGQSVAPGEILGTVGATGDAAAAGPHLHFAMMRTSPERTWSQEAEAINPYPLLAR